MINGQTFKTKTFWAGLTVIVGGALHMAGVATGPVYDGIMTVIGGLAAIFVRDAIAKASNQ